MSINEFNVFDSTVKYNHCIGCGICDASCPHDAIDMSYNENKEIIPIINDKCTQCTICVKYCPHTNKKIEKTMNKALNSENAFLYGLEDAQIFVAYDKDKESRLKSASGGALSAFLKHLLENKIIDCVIHADYNDASLGEQHYKASISRSVEEIDNKRSSFYSPISFEDQIKQFQNKEENILFVGVPCVIRGVKYLFTKNSLYKKNNLYTIALACSHTVNGMFIDNLANSEGFFSNNKFRVNLRNKDDIKDANQFNNHFFTEKNDFIKKNRFSTIFTTTWRNYYFSLNICSKCSDFWGVDADISVKDAWGKWSIDPLGKSIVVIRNSNLAELFKDCENIEKLKITANEAIDVQRPQAKFKHEEIKDRVTSPFYSLTNIRNGYFRKKLASELSKYTYKNFGYKFSSIIMKGFEKLASFTNLIFPEKLMNIFNYKKTKSMNRIFIVGGFGYTNTGDEAQINMVLKNLDKYFPNYFKILGSHNRMSTSRKHQHLTMFDSPREAFFDHNSSKMYWLNTKWDYAHFFINSVLIYLNAFLVRAELPTFFINAKKAALLNELKNSDLLFFGGGGYLTGKTLSRLYDGMLLINIAKIFDLKIVLSGQTIGIWKNSVNEFFAKNTFNKVDLITLRDPVTSILELKKIGIKDEKLEIVCDDALFSETLDEENFKNVMKLNKFLLENFICVNIHYWGLNSREEKEFYLKQMNSIINFLIENYDYDIVFIPMLNTDNEAIIDYINKYPHNRIYKFEYDFDFKVIRTLIKNSKICITMKHHPIIFSLGEGVPVISLCYSDYYFHKNEGALELFDAKEFNLDISKDFIFNFQEKFLYIQNNYDFIKEKFLKRKDEIRIIQDNFYKKVQKLLKN